MKDSKPPKFPLSQIHREGDTKICKLCGSTIKTNFFGVEKGCRQPECENYFNKEK